MIYQKYHVRPEESYRYIAYGKLHRFVLEGRQLYYILKNGFAKGYAKAGESKC